MGEPYEALIFYRGENSNKGEEKEGRKGRGKEMEGEKEADVISFLSIILEVFRQFLALVIRPISSLTWQLQTLISPISWAHLRLDGYGFPNPVLFIVLSET